MCSFSAPLKTLELLHLLPAFISLWHLAFQKGPQLILYIKICLQVLGSISAHVKEAGCSYALFVRTPMENNAA